MREFKLWRITSFEEYEKSWRSIAGEFTALTDYQKALGFKTAEDFFHNQAYAIQTMVNSRVGNLLDRVFMTSELIEPIKDHLKKFTYHAIDFLRMNDVVVSEKERLNQIFLSQTPQQNKYQTFSLTNFDIDPICEVVGAMSWRHWILASIQDLYIAWATRNYHMS